MAWNLALILAVSSGLGGPAAATTHGGTGVSLAIDYVPFEMHEIISPVTGLPAKATELLKIEIQGKVLFEGAAIQLLSVLNVAEQFYCRQGHSLRSDGPIPWGKILTDSNLMNAQLLNTLRVSLTALDKVRDSLKECPRLRVDYFGFNLKTRLPYRGVDVVQVEGNNLNLQSFVDRINDQQTLLCSLGWSMVPDFGGAPRGADLLLWILDRRLTVMNELSISKFHPSFNMEAMLPLKTLAEMAKDVESYLSKQQLPGFGDIKKLAAKYNIPIPHNLKIPDVPEMPEEWKSVEVPRHHELKLVKRKEWKGIDAGDRKRFALLATAYYEVRGSDKKDADSEVGVAATAEAKAAAYVFGREYCPLQGGIQLHADERHVDGLATLRITGKDLMDSTFNETMAYTYGKPDLLAMSLDWEASTQFTIGPVPVYVAASAMGRATLGWEVGVSPLQLRATLLPSVEAAASVAGGVGFVGVLSAGAQGTVVLVKLGPTLQGEAALELRNPTLTLSLSADAVYSALSGRADAFVEYPVPRCGLPPWKAERANFEIFKWAGFEGHNHIMGWRTKLTPFTMEMSGDIIDQNDRAEAQALQQALDFEARDRAVAQLRRAAVERKQAVLKAIVADLSSESSRRIPEEVAVLAALPHEIDNARIQYLQQLNTSLAGGAP